MDEKTPAAVLRRMPGQAEVHFELAPDLANRLQAIAGHVSQRMLEHYSRIRMDAKRTALDGIATPVFQTGVHQNVHQFLNSAIPVTAKPLN